jgi:hypothetical protein
VIIRNDVRTAINMRLGSMHARHLGVRPILWRNNDSPASGSVMNEFAKTNAQNMPAAYTELMPTIAMVFPGCLCLFVDNDLPIGGVAKNATCVVRGLVVDHREPEDTKTSDAWMLRYPPIAVFVEPREGRIEEQTVHAMSQKYPDLPNNCFAVEARSTESFKVINDRLTTTKPRKGDSYSLVKRNGIPLAEGYAVTDHYCQGANFKEECWLAHITPPPAGTFERASVFVITTRWTAWADLLLLAPLWREGDAKQRLEVIPKFQRAAVMSQDLHDELVRLRQAAEDTKARYSDLWELAVKVCSQAL